MLAQAGVDLFATSSEQMAPTGTRREYYDPATGKTLYLRCVKNNTGGTLTPGSTGGIVMAYSSGSSLLVARAGAAAPKNTVAGITPFRAGYSILANYYFWVIAEGDVTGISDADIAANAAILVSVATADGYVDDDAVAGVEHCIIGWSLGSAVGASAAITFRIDV